MDMANKKERIAVLFNALIYETSIDKRRLCVEEIYKELDTEQVSKLIRALEIRQEQLNASFYGKKRSYPTYTIHHQRDVATVLAVLKGDKDADKLLDNMPTEQDRPIEQ